MPEQTMEEKVEAALKEELEVRMGKGDGGHNNLLDDLNTLFKDAYEYGFHDFKSKEATPKVALIERLVGLIKNVKSGQYDN